MTQHTFDFVNALNSAVKWSEIAGMSYDNSEFIPQKEDAFVEEYQELIDAEQENNVAEIVDGIFDTTFTFLNLLASDINSYELFEVIPYCQMLSKFHGYDYQKLWEVGIENNFSKFIKIEAGYEQRVSATYAKYAELGIVISDFTVDHYVGFRTMNKTQVDKNGKMYYANKIVKPAGWQEPDWSQAKIVVKW